ncbi:MAG: T9SS type A sorting domain-containing protein, partial [Candidatus Sabulitectum sp.]|nr:T9SS type A sorting domain-containing protein [Candidatus Sabulitectum sp.]
TDRIWMRGYVHEDVLWNSQEDGVFVRDTPSGNADHTALVQEEMGQMFPSKPDAAYAVHYTYQGDLPSEFCGTIQSFIGTECTGVLSGGVPGVSTVSRSSTLGPRDLAGHLMDADPSTVPATRQGFESWDGVSPGLHSGYESQSEPHYFWGVPSWSISGGMAFARISADTVAEVDLVATGLQDAVFFGGCFPWYGFWMYHEVVGETGFNIPVIRYDGVVVNHSFNTKFPVGTQVTGNQFWHGRLRRGPFGGTEYIVSQDQCYFWMTGGNIGLYESEKTVTCISDAYVYSVNSQTGATSSRLLAVGTTSQDNSDIEAPPTAHSKICRIYQSGAALVEYSTPYGILQYDILYPPGGGATDVTEESSLTAMEDVSIAVEQERSFAVLSNPAKESLDVLVFGSSGDKWNLAVFDISGRCVLADTGVCREVGSVLNYGTGSFPSGIYIIRIEVEGEDEVQSISIVH